MESAYEANHEYLAENFHQSELYFREAFLRTIRETVDNLSMTEDSTIEQLRGIMNIAETFQQLGKELEK